MTTALTHRGPDDAGFLETPDAALGVRRLSIIDVPAGHQPIANEDGTVVVAFNGEIYNFRDLRSRLEATGHSFTTQSDTEILPHLYEQYGDASVHLLQGMFAFALWDEMRNGPLLARLGMRGQDAAIATFTVRVNRVRHAAVRYEVTLVSRSPG